MITPIIFGIFTGFVMSISLGAVFFLLVQAGLMGGLRKGIPLAIGVIFGDFICMVLALEFSDFITNFLTDYKLEISILGTLVFFTLAFHHFFHHYKSKNDGLEMRLANMSNLQMGFKSFAINMANPVNVVWWLGLYTLPPGAEFDYYSKWVFGITVIASVFVTELCISWSAGKLKLYLTEDRIKQLDLIIGLLFSCMGLYLLYRSYLCYFQ